MSLKSDGREDALAVYKFLIPDRRIVNGVEYGGDLACAIAHSVEEAKAAIRARNPGVDPEVWPRAADWLDGATVTRFELDGVRVLCFSMAFIP